MKSQKNGEKPKHIIFFRRSALFITCSLLFIALFQIVGATPPSDMTVSYNLQTHELQVTITHPVSNPTTHYIQEVKIVKNGVLYNTSLYDSQPDTNRFTYSYQVNATTGDTIDVTATCIQGQSLTIQHSITADNGDSKKSTPGFEIIVLLGALFISLILLHKKYIH